MKKLETKNKDRHELENLLREFRQKLNQLYFDLAEKRLKDVNEIKKVKKNIARIATSLHQ